MVKKKYLATGLIVAGVVLLCLYILRGEFRAPVFDLYFFNLNKGHGAFIETPQRKTILIDGGQTSEVIRELTKILPFYRRHIDYVIATRADAKNVGGLVDVLRRYDIGKIIEPSTMGTSTAMDAFEKIVKQKRIPIQKVSKGDQIAIDSMQIRVLFPDPTFTYNRSNIPELAFEVQIGTSSVVFLGDTSTRIQKSLIPDLDHVHIVEFANGATKSRVSADLLSKLTPDVLVSTKREETLRFTFIK